MDSARELVELRKRVPFLKELPDSIFFGLDSSEFVIPDSEINDARTELEQKLNHFVMPYKATCVKPFALSKNHLCANLKAAQLTKKQVQLLQQYERKAKPLGASFSVYQKPLALK